MRKKGFENLTFTGCNVNKEETVMQIDKDKEGW